MFKNPASKNPANEKKKGIHFKVGAINSDSIKKTLLENENITLFQVGTPNPTKKSYPKYPIKMLLIDNKINGKKIKNEDSDIEL